MDRARRLARLPGNLHAAALDSRTGPYLKLPDHLVSRHAAARDVRDDAYRSILPEGAVTSDGMPFKAKFLRRAAHRALTSRAQVEASLLHASGQHDQALVWEAGIEAAQGAYQQDMRDRRDLYFRALERAAPPSHDDTAAPPEPVAAASGFRDPASSGAASSGFREPASIEPGFAGAVGTLFHAWLAVRRTNGDVTRYRFVARSQGTFLDTAIQENRLLLSLPTLQWTVSVPVEALGPWTEKERRALDAAGAPALFERATDQTMELEEGLDRKGDTMDPAALDAIERCEVADIEEHHLARMEGGATATSSASGSCRSRSMHRSTSSELAQQEQHELELAIAMSLSMGAVRVVDVG